MGGSGGGTDDASSDAGSHTTSDAAGQRPVDSGAPKPFEAGDELPVYDGGARCPFTLLGRDHRPVPVCTDRDADRYLGVTQVCFEVPSGPEGCGAIGVGCILNAYSCGLTQRGDDVACGPFRDVSGACCYEVTGECAIGRPLTIDGTARVAPAASRSHWSAELSPAVDGLDASSRRTLADLWTREGLAEHASMASFARAALELLALGAPAELIRLACEAALDECEHARIAFGLASAYGGRPVGPGELATEGALADLSLVGITERLTGEGCVAETVSAGIVAAARDAARDPAVRAALEVVARDEAAHAVLAWRQLAWLISVGGEPAKAAARRMLAQAHRHVGIGPVPDGAGGDETVLRSRGWLPPDERRAVARGVLAGVVLPAAEALGLVAAAVACTSHRVDSAGTAVDVAW